jgi:hypothetical protein
MTTKLVPITAAAFVGSALIATAPLLNQQRLARLLGTRSSPSGEIDNITREYKTSTGCPICSGVSVFRGVTINAPHEIRIDESATIRFRYSDRRPGLDPSDSQVSYSFDVTLSGANFDVKPTETQKVEPVNSRQAIASLAWTIKPKGTGTHVVIVDFSGLIRNVNSRMWEKTVVAGEQSAAGRSEPIEVQSAALLSDAIVELPITVLSEWSVSANAVSMAKATLSLTGFIFVTPGVWWLARQIRSGRPHAKRRSTASTKKKS